MTSRPVAASRPLRATEGRPSASSSSSSSSKLLVGARCIIAQDADIRGTVSIGEGTVVHPKASIQALDEEGSITIGKECIIEELAQIVHHGKGTMTVGDSNLFEVGCRIESRSIGSHNTFECKSRVTDGVAVPDFCTVGAACIAQPPLDWGLIDGDDHDAGRVIAETGAAATASMPIYTLPSRSVIYGAQSQMRQWSGNGVRQADALHAKHLDHLRRNIPEFHALRIIR